MPARPRPALRNRVEYLLASFVLLTLRRTSLAVANRLGHGYAKVLDAVLPRLRAAALRNLEMALPEMGVDERKRTVDGVYRSIGRVLVSFARFPDLDAKNISDWICYDGFEHFEEARRRGRGVLFATGHLGNWELSAFAHALLCAPMHVVVRPLDNPLIDALVERRRALSGNRIIAKKDFARSILTALHRNEAVGILVDQNAGLDHGTFVDFFGIPACSGTSFARIAAHSGAAVLPGFAIWHESEQRYRLKFYPLLEMSGDVVEDTRRLQAVVERAVREHPEQWLWIHRRWKTRPPSESDRYA